MMRAIRRVSTATLLILALCSCSKKKGETTETTASATPGAETTGATPTTGPAPSAPADVPSFLDRLCAAVSSGDKAYVTSHIDTAFTSDQATDPAKCGGKTGKRCFRRAGGQHAEPDLAPVCTRIKAQPRASLANGAPDQSGATRIRLVDNDLVSDLIIARQGSDFRLLREAAPPKR